MCSPAKPLIASNPSKLPAGTSPPRSIIKFLVINQYDSRPINLAWKWFSAEKLSVKDKEELKVNHDTSNEADVSVRIAEIFQMNAVAYKGKNRIVIFADEVDQIDSMRTGADAVSALLRKMLESELEKMLKI